MPVVLILVGVVFMIAAVRGTHKELGDLLRDQFATAQSFTIYLLVLTALAMIGLYKPAQPFARAFMGLVLLVMALRNSQNTSLFAQARTQTEGSKAAIKESGTIAQSEEIVIQPPPVLRGFTTE